MEEQTTTDISNKFTQVTPLSKALAAILFIILPFVGLYVGYTFAPTKVVEKIIIKEPQPVEIDPYTPGEEFQAYTVSSIEKTKVNSSVFLVFADSAERKLTGTVQAGYDFYGGGYMLQFIPDGQYPLPILPGIEVPERIRLINLSGDLTDEINQLCGASCVPEPDAAFEELDTFDLQNYEWEVVVEPIYITYEYYNGGAGTQGNYITITGIEKQ